MNYEIQKDDYFDILCERLLILVTDFRPVLEISDGQYPLLGEFSSFLIENISNEKVLNESINFITEVFEKGKYKSKDAIIEQVFTRIHDSSSATEIFSRMLKNVALESFNLNK